MSGLPSGWAIAEIEEVIADQKDGKRIHQGWSPQCEKEPCNSSEQWGVLKTTAIQAGEFQWEHHKRLPSHLEPRTAIEVSVGDLLMTCAGPRIRCGVACLVRATRSKLMISGKVYRFRAMDGVTDGRYLEAFLQTQGALLQIDAMKTGGSDSGLNLTHERFKKLRIPIAPYNEQIRIVAKLEELLSDLDAGVAELKAAQKKLAQYRQSLLKAAVEGFLTAEWRKQQRENGGPQESGADLLGRILRERRICWEAKQLTKFAEQGKAPPKDWQKKYPEPATPNTTHLSELPEGWVWINAETLFTWGSGDFLPATAQVEGDFPVYGGNGINGSHNAANVLQETIVIGRVGVHCGNVYRVPKAAWITDNAIYATTKHDSVTWKYASLVMRSARLGSNAKGGAQPFISQTILNSTPIALPSLDEQEEIVRLLEEQQTSIDNRENEISLLLKQSAAQRQNILRAAFSGQLVPQDPGDEPAAALLARIRASRDAATPAKRTRKVKETA